VYGGCEGRSARSAGRPDALLRGREGKRVSDLASLGFYAHLRLPGLCLQLTADGRRLFTHPNDLSHDRRALMTIGNSSQGKRLQAGVPASH